MTVEKYEVSGVAGSNEILFTALGGLGVIGMNFYLYGYNGKWLVVDCGIGFAGDEIPGVDILLADPVFIEERRDDIVGLILTHAHEDHIGALAYMYDSLQCPIYATAFTANVTALKLESGGHTPESILRVVDTGSRFDVGPFDIEFIDLTHSIPEPQGVIIRTTVGTIFHTGDWKFDDNPMVGVTSDIDKLKAISEEGVLVLVGDSTNVMSKNHSESEGDVRDSLARLMSPLRGRIGVTCFASNIARVESIALSATANGRKVALVGRSLWRMTRCARDAGYLQDCPKFYEAEDLVDMPSNEVLYIFTGSQGESRAGLARVARDENHDVSFGHTDTMIFSARAIPGNEKSISFVQNMLIEQGVCVITASDAFVHASGHGAREEMAQMYDIIKPKFAIPMHGEALHLARHGQLAQEKGVDKCMVLNTGDLVSITANDIICVDEVPTSLLIMDGERITPIDSSAVRQRRKMAFAGLIVVSCVVDAYGGLLSEPKITAEGISMPDAQDRSGLVLDVERTVKKCSKGKVSTHSMEETIRLSVRRYVMKQTGKKPVVKVHLVCV